MEVFILDIFYTVFWDAVRMIHKIDRQYGFIWFKKDSNPYTEGIYVFYGVKGVIKMVIFGVNDWSFLTALDTFGKTKDHAEIQLLHTDTSA